VHLSAGWLLLLDGRLGFVLLRREQHLQHPHGPQHQHHRTLPRPQRRGHGEQRRTLFFQGTGKFTGPGHFAILSEGGQQWFSYHYYDAGAYAPWYNAYGVSEFDLEPLSWTADNWPYFTNDWSAVYNFQSDALDGNGQYYGLLLNGASIQNDPSHGHVLNLTGTNQYVQLPPGVAFARTFSAVVKWNGGAAWQRIFDFAWTRQSM